MGFVVFTACSLQESLAGRVDDASDGQHSAARLQVDDEDKRSVDRQSGGQRGENTGSAPCTVTVGNRHHSFMKNLKQQTGSVDNRQEVLTTNRKC